MTEAKRQCTVLVAEDDTLIRKSTTAFLQSRGYEIQEAEDGLKALELLRDRKPDILLTDLRMSGLDGAELLKISLRELPFTPVIIISGMGTMQDAIELLRLGAFDYINKPVQDMELILHSVHKAQENAELKKREQNRQSELENLVQQRTMELLQQNRQLEREMKNRQAQEALVLHAKQEWERTVDAMPDMIAIIDENHHIVRMNRTMRERFGKSYEDILDQPCFNWLHRSHNPLEQCPIKKP